MPKTACPVVWEGPGAQSLVTRPDKHRKSHAKTQRRKGKTEGIAAKNAKKKTKGKLPVVPRFMARREPPSRCWPANLTKRPSQRDTLSRLVQSLHLSFSCVFCSFSRLFSFCLNLCAFASLREFILRFLLYLPFPVF